MYAKYESMNIFGMILEEDEGGIGTFMYPFGYPD
jgi:hypothetical protein